MGVLGEGSPLTGCATVRAYPNACLAFLNVGLRGMGDPDLVAVRAARRLRVLVCSSGIVRAVRKQAGAIRKASKLGGLGASTLACTRLSGPALGRAAFGARWQATTASACFAAAMRGRGTSLTLHFRVAFIEAKSLR